MSQPQPIAVVTGLRGMDGSYIAEQLLEEGYKVYGLIRRSSQGLDLGCSKHLEAYKKSLEVVEGDLLDLPGLCRLVSTARPNLFFNMASQSHVGSSFDQPVYTAQVTGLGVLNCLEAIRLSGIHTRFLQASTSELYGGLSSAPADETAPFHPKSPYGVAKLYGYWITVNYREAYKMFACNSICFNHEGPRRGPNFVTRKITMAAARIKTGMQKKLALGNLDSKRDWGYAPDFTSGMIDILTKTNTPDDYVMATGEAHTVREFCEAAFNHVGLDYRDHVIIDPRFYRPAEVDVLVGDYSKINKAIGWEPSVTFKELVVRMVNHDMHLLGPSL